MENLKQEVQQLQIYQQICEHSQDLIAMITSDPKALFIYTSASHGRVIGFQPHHLVPGQTSFLDLVHPVRSASTSLFSYYSQNADSCVCTCRTMSLKYERFSSDWRTWAIRIDVRCSSFWCVWAALVYWILTVSVSMCMFAIVRFRIKDGGRRALQRRDVCTNGRHGHRVLHACG